ncbi:glycosyltransferase family 4 protein [uncultured Thiocystis sp.]|uniref:glycosyltransferase family 4 protein n=1 Tax=uncultured Thiocystis sp. TaxID=1202134 RepID=UPI0025DFD004|nr:glycosyltransferase family 4 protein [uncultured Thiocystis sp.]
MMLQQLPIKALFIVPSLRRAGAETQVVNLVNRLDANQIEKHLLVFEKEIDQLDRLDQDCVRFHHVLRTRRWFDWNLILMISHVINVEKIDVIHCSSPFTAFWGWLASKYSVNKPPVIAAIHTTISRGLKEELQNRFIYQWILRRCDAIVFVCMRQREYWLKKYHFLEGNSEVIYNGIDTDHFEPIAFIDEGRLFRKIHEIPYDATVLTCIAGFRPEKGQKILVDAYAMIDRKDTFVVFAGDGQTRQAIQDQVTAYGIGDRVCFIGEVADVRPVLASTNLLILPSTAVETFSMAMLEALSMEIPVLASDIGGMSEAVIEGSTGSLFQPGNTENLACKINSLTSDLCSLQLMGKNGRKLVLSQFREDQMVSEMAALLRRIVYTKSLTIPRIDAT